MSNHSLRSSGRSSPRTSATVTSSIATGHVRDDVHAGRIIAGRRIARSRTISATKALPLPYDASTRGARAQGPLRCADLPNLETAPQVLRGSFLGRHPPEIEDALEARACRGVREPLRDGALDVRVVAAAAAHAVNGEIGGVHAHEGALDVAGVPATSQRISTRRSPPPHCAWLSSWPASWRERRAPPPRGQRGARGPRSRSRPRRGFSMARPVHVHLACKRDARACKVYVHASAQVAGPCSRTSSGYIQQVMGGSDAAGSEAHAGPTGDAVERATDRIGAALGEEENRARVPVEPEDVDGDAEEHATRAELDRPPLRWSRD